jgi:hypothetical protein
MWAISTMLILSMVVCSGCATSQPNSQLAAKHAGCSSDTDCRAGYQCSNMVIGEMDTGLCITGPTRCTSDADCVNSAATESTTPLHYACDKHSGLYPDKTGGASVSDSGTCMPTAETGMRQ